MRCLYAQRISKSNIKCTVDNEKCPICRWCSDFGGVIQTNGAKDCTKASKEK